MSDEPDRFRWATTKEVAEAAGVTDSTVMKWAAKGVLPAYTTVYGGARGRAARWPLHAPAQAAWVKARLDQGLTFSEVGELLARGEFKAPAPAAEG